MPFSGANGATCSTPTGCRGGNRTILAVHNAMMYTCWVIFMMIVLSSARYFRHYWRKSIYIHVTFGIGVFVITVTASMMAWGFNY